MSSDTKRLACPEQDQATEHGKLLRQYLHVRKTEPVLNSAKLAEVIHAVAEMHLFEKSNPGFRVALTTSDPDATQTESKVGEALPIVLNMIGQDLSRSTAEGPDVHNIAATLSSIFVSREFEWSTKLDLLSIETNLIAPSYWRALRDIPEQDIEKMLVTRTQLLSEHMTSIANQFPEKVEAAAGMFGSLLRSYEWIYLHKVAYQEAGQLLLRLLPVVRSQPGLLSKAALRLVRFNNLFTIWTKDEILSELEDYISLVSPENNATILEANKHTFDKVEFKDIGISLVDHGLGRIDLDTVTTLVHFVIPRPLTSENATVTMPDGVQIELYPVKSLPCDPVFRFLDQVDIALNEMPVGVVCDSYPNYATCTSVSIIFPYFFHPDFEVIDGEISDLSFDDESALMGRQLYPVKQKSVEILRDLRKQLEPFPVDIKLEEIDLNLFSAFMVDYRDNSGASVFHRVHTLTNWDKYQQAVKTLGEARQHSDIGSFLAIPSLLQHTQQPSTDSELRVFMREVITLGYKKNVEQAGLWLHHWEDGNPVLERVAQPLAAAQTGTIASFKGVKLSREVVCANGGLDFLCSSTSPQGPGLAVCVEMKRAHADLISGLTSQLPAYMDAQSTRDGIYIVLWFKGESFDKPTQYKSISAMRDDLIANVPAGLKIDIIVVDCTKPTPPSRLKSNTQTP